MKSTGLTVTRPTHNGAVVQLVRAALTLRDSMMGLPATLTLHTTTSQTNRDPARNSMLMTLQPALTSSHRPHPRLTQNLRRKNQLASQDSQAGSIRFIVYRQRAKETREVTFC